MSAPLPQFALAALDAAAARAVPSQRHLGGAWFAAASEAYGGALRVISVEAAGAVPLVGMGPRWLGMSAVAGSYWPARSAPLVAGANDAAIDALLDALAAATRVLRIGPVADDDPLVTRLVARARVGGWGVLDRVLGESWRLTVPHDGDWPRASTAKKNRWFEKRLGEHGAAEWRHLSGSDWTPALFDTLAGIERASWVGTDTDARDAKFASAGHGAFWRVAARDPALADRMRVALLTLGGRPAAFSFDLDAGPLRHVIANSYDPAFAAHSPGRVLAWRNLAAMRREGVTTVDWGSGDSGYKAGFGAVAGPRLRDWLLVRPGPAAHAARAIAYWRR